MLAETLTVSNVILVAMSSVSLPGRGHEGGKPTESRVFRH